MPPKNFVVLLVTLGILAVLPGLVYGQEDGDPVLLEETPQAEEGPILDLASDSEPLRTGTFTVDSTGDQGDAVLDGLCATSVGTCTLRAAAQEADVNDTQDRIIFNIPTSDPGFIDHDGGAADMVGGDDYWTINYQGSSNDLFNSAIVLDVASQTVNQGNTNASGSEIKVNFSSNPEIRGASTSSKVLGASTPQTHLDSETLYYIRTRFSSSTNNWDDSDISRLRDVGLDSDGNIYLSGQTTTNIVKLDTSGEMIANWQADGSGGGDSANCVVPIDIYVYTCVETHIDKFDRDGNFISSFGTSGSGLGQFTFIYDMDVDSVGNFYVTDSTLCRVSKFDSNWNYLLSWGSCGSGNGQFTVLRPVGIDSSDNVYTGETNGNRVQKFDTSGNYITKWGSTGSGNGQFTFLESISVAPDGHVYTVDNGQRAIQKFTSTGVWEAKWDATVGGQFDAGNLWRNDVGPDGNIYYISSNESVVVAIDNTGNFVKYFGAASLLSGGVNSPASLYADTSGNIYITTLNNLTNLGIGKFDYELTAATHFQTDSNCPSAFNDIDRDSAGNFYATRSGFTPGRICKFDSNGNILTWWTINGIDANSNSIGIAVDPSDNIWVVDQTNRKIKKFSNTGTFITSFGSNGTGNGQFSTPRDVAIDSAGNIYVSDTNASTGNDIQKFNSAGVYQATRNGSESGQNFSSPFSLAIDSEDNLWVLDRNNHKLKEYDSTFTYMRTFSIGNLATPYIGVRTGIAIDEVHNRIYFGGSQSLNIVDIFGFDFDDPEITIDPLTDDETTETAPIFTGTIEDPVSPLTAIWYTVDDDAETTDCLVEDNVIDEREEEFTCYIAGELSLGEHTITVYATDSEEHTSSQEYTFTVVGAAVEPLPEEPEEEPVYEFSLIEPIDGAVIEDNTPKLDWQDVDAASSIDFYDLYINNKFVKNTGTTSDYQIPDAGALPNGEYTWQVLAYKFEDGEAVEITRSGIEAFTVKAAISAPEPEEPVTPPETGEEPKPEKPNPTTPNLPDFVTNVRDFKLETLAPTVGIVAATATVAISTSLLTAGKDILEKLGFVIGGIVPKKRRYWGIVFDAIKSQGIPFAVIRVYQNKKLLNTTVTDLDGRYGIPVSESGTFDLEVKAQGFKPYNKQISLGISALQEISENIAMERSGERLDPFRHFFFYHMNEILMIFRLLVLKFMIGGFLYSLYVFMQFPILLNLVVLVLYLALFGANLYQEYKHRRNVEGRVIDLTMRTGLPNTTVILYNAKGDQEDVRLTNAKGVAKLRAKSGTYQVQALKSGYAMSDVEFGKASLELKVDERGYLTKAVFMKKSE